jgi:hypothetical protein
MASCCPAALVWVQSDTLSTAQALRRRFWRHGGFAPSARHAAAAAGCSAASNGSAGQQLPALLAAPGGLASHEEPWLGEAEVAGLRPSQQVLPPQQVLSEPCSSEADADGWAALPWLMSNPLGVPTERELYVQRGGRQIYRLLLVRA